MSRPVYVLPGNHDDGTGNGVPGYFDKYFPTPSMPFVYGDNVIVMIDPTSIERNVMQEDIEKIEKAIAENPNAKNIFILCHEVIWYNASQQEEPPFQPNGVFDDAADSSNFEESVLPLFDNCNAAVYFIAGDAGVYMPAYYRNDGRTSYIASGMGLAGKDNILEVRVLTDGTVDLYLRWLGNKIPFA